MDITVLQPMALNFGLIAIGILLLIQGGNWTIDSAVLIAKRYGLSPMIVGFTILAFGTSMPELIVSVLAVLRGSEGIAMGNVIGSNIANILLVVGSCAVVSTLLVTVSKGLIKDLVMMLLSSALLIGLMLHGEVSRVAGLIMFVLLLLYVFVQYRMALKGEIEVEEQDVDDTGNPYKPYLLLLLGLVGVAGGAEFLVRGASGSATILGVPEDVIALSVVALGTSLPELSTSIVAVRRGQAEMLLGNIIGSNVFNVLMIIGISAMVKPIVAGSYAAQLIEFDVWFMMAISFIFVAILLLFRRVNKVIGIGFVSAYVLYTIYIYSIYFVA